MLAGNYPIVKKEIIFQLKRRHGFLAGAIVAASVLLPSRQGLPKLCLFHRVTAHPCPFCGLSRSFVALGHADPVLASKYNLLGIPLFALFVGLAGRSLTAKDDLRLPLSSRRAMAVVGLVIIAWLVKLRFVPRRYW